MLHRRQSAVPVEFELVGCLRSNSDSIVWLQIEGFADEGEAYRPITEEIDLLSAMSV